MNIFGYFFIDECILTFFRPGKNIHYTLVEKKEEDDEEDEEDEEDEGCLLKSVAIKLG